MAAAARISLHIHKLVSKKGHWFLKKAKILPKLFESLVNIVTSFVWLRLYWLRLRRRKPLCLLDLKIKPFSLVLKIKGNLGSIETRALKELQCGHALVHMTLPCMSHVLV